MYNSGYKSPEENKVKRASLTEAWSPRVSFLISFSIFLHSPTSSILRISLDSAEAGPWQAYIPTLKPRASKLHPRASKLQCKTPHANTPIKRNTTLNIKRQAVQSHTKPTDTIKRTTGHCIALQREAIQFHPTEHRHKFAQPENLHKPLVQTHPQGAVSITKRNYNHPAYRKETPNTAH